MSKCDDWGEYELLLKYNCDLVFMLTLLSNFMIILVNLFHHELTKSY